MKVLLIEDNSEDARLIERMLTQGRDLIFDVEWVDCLATGLDRLAAEPDIQIVLLDLSLPDSQGVQAVVALRDQMPRVPLVVLTGFDDGEMAFRALREGAQDYLVKGNVDSQLLVRVMRYAIERKRAAEALRESEERYRTVSELTSDFAFAFHIEPDGTLEFEWATEAFVRITGFRDEEVRARGGWQTLIHPDDLPALLRRIQGFFAGSSRDSGEIRIVAKSGETRWLQVYGRLVKEERIGGALRIVGAAQDVTDRKQAEEALRAERDRAQTYLNVAGTMILALDVQGKIVLINQKGCQVLGYEDERALLGRDWFEVAIPPDSREAVKDMFKAVMAGQIDSLEFYENEIVTKDGEKRIIAWHSTDLKDEASHIIGTLSSGEDITERVWAEAALRRRTEQLETLRQAAQDLTALLDLDPLLCRIAERAVELLRAEAGGIYLYRPERQVLEWVASVGEKMWRVGLTMGPGEGVVGRVWSTGEPLVVDDYGSWPGQSPQWSNLGARAVIGVPIQWGDEFLGVLNVRSDVSGSRFTPEDVRLLSQLAAQAAIAIQNTYLYDQARRRAQELSALNKAGQAVTSTLDLDAVLKLVMSEVKSLVGAQGASVLLYDPASNELEFAAVVGPSAEGLVGTRMSATVGIAGWVVLQNRAVLVDDALTDPRFYGRIDAMTGLTTRSILAVPLRVKGQVRGVVEAISQEAGAFSQEHLGLLERMSASAAVAIENARLYQAESEQRQLAETLRHVGETLVSALDTEVVLDRLLEQVARVVPNDATNIMLIQDGRARVVRWHGYERFGAESLVETLDWAVDEMPNLRQMLKVGGPVAISDTYASEEWARLRGLGWLRSYAGAPIRVRDRVIGFLNVDSATPGFFGPQHAERLRAFADQAAIALQNARLFEEIRQTAERLKTLSQRLVQVEEEQRRYVASELHDQVGQILTGLKITLDMMAQLPAEAVGDYLGQALDLVDELIGRVRDLSLDLRPAMLDDLGLVPALLWHFERYTNQTGINVTFKQLGVEGRRFPSEIETAAYRIVQESLTNVARYAGVGQATVRAWSDEATLNLQVEDWGAGFDVEPILIAGASGGLAGMRERANLLAGWLIIESQPGRGTLITVGFPLDDGGRGG